MKYSRITTILFFPAMLLLLVPGVFFLLPAHIEATEISTSTLSEDVYPNTDQPVDDITTHGQADYLNDIEKEVVLHLNMARTDPGRYAAKFIKPRIRYFAGKRYREPWQSASFVGYRTHEGKKAVHECIAVMESTLPIKRLLPSKGLSLAAKDHARFQSRTGRIGHRGPDGSKPGTRLRQHYNWRITGENISYGLNTAREIVACLLVDDGVHSRGHRSIILDPQFSIVGVAIERHPLHRYVCVINFAGN